MRFTCNLEIQLVLKQGQVEVESGDFIQIFDDCVLLHRSVIEDLNASIRVSLVGCWMNRQTTCSYCSLKC